MSDRNSQGCQGAVGTDVDITSILFGEMSFGYSGRHYDSSELKDTNGFGAQRRADLERHAADLRDPRPAAARS